MYTLIHGINILYIVYNGGVSNEVCGTGSLPQGSVSRVCFVVCFGGLLRGSVSHSSTSHSLNSRVCFVVWFEGMFRGSVSPKSNFPALLKVALPYLKLHSQKKYKPI